MIPWNYIVIGLSLLLLISLCTAEIKRVNKARLAGRLLASALAVAGLAFMALPVLIRKNIPQENNSRAILLTEGYSKDSVENFLKNTGEKTLVYPLDSIASIDTNITALHIFGNGLAADQLNLLKEIPLVFHPSKMQNGVVAVHWKQTLLAGEKLRVQGFFSNTLAVPLKISLIGFNTTLDSMIIPAKQSNAFELGSTPKHTGRAVFSLLMMNNNDTLTNEPIPINIKPVDTLNILVLSASPDFEHKFLKNWLSQKGYSVAGRTRISKEKFEKTFLNIASVPLERITGSLLNRFDILVSDASELAALSKSEEAAIHAQVQEGMGLLINADSVAPSAVYAARFTQYSSPGKQSSLLFARDLSNPLAALPGEQNIYIRNKPGEQPLILNAYSNILVSSSMESLGTIVFSTINNTYSWMLSGNNGDYSRFWSSLLQKAAKRSGPHFNMLVNGSLPTMNAQVDLNCEHAAIDLAGIKVDGSPVSLQQNPQLPFQWQGTFWPPGPGWQIVDFAEVQFPLYVFAKDDWKNIAAIDKTRQTYQYIHRKNNQGKKDFQVQKYTRTALPRYYFLLIFITCCCFLWVEKKLSAS
ncbi:MAG: hypothetical protein JWP81_1333 [Ferruginibacter sp.]|nr:hypothetical protein [Ferruginibacter sp.]